MINWEDYLLQQWRKQSKKYWLLRKLFGEVAHEENSVRVPMNTDSQVDLAYSTRIICGAIMMPTFASACGSYLFGGIDSPIKRTFMGGFVFIGLKGIVEMYYKQQQYARLARRQIADYDESFDSSTSA